jgi:hypothetical protein
MTVMCDAIHAIISLLPKTEISIRISSIVSPVARYSKIAEARNRACRINGLPMIMKGSIVIRVDKFSIINAITALPHYLITALVVLPRLLLHMSRPFVQLLYGS